MCHVSTIRFGLVDYGNPEELQTKASIILLITAVILGILGCAFGMLILKGPLHHFGRIIGGVSLSIGITSLALGLLIKCKSKEKRSESSSNAVLESVNKEVIKNTVVIKDDEITLSLQRNEKTLLVKNDEGLFIGVVANHSKANQKVFDLLKGQQGLLLNLFKRTSFYDQKTREDIKALSQAISLQLAVDDVVSWCLLHYPRQYIYAKIFNSFIKCDLTDTAQRLSVNPIGEKTEYFNFLSNQHQVKLGLADTSLSLF